MAHFVKIVLLISVFIGIASEAYAEPATIEASGPIIYLVDNLDQEGGLGWCIDTIGQGFSDKLHTRACTPDDESQDRDFSFTYDPQSGRIAAVAFDGKCIAINTDSGEPTLGLSDCMSENLSQKFSYEAEQLAFHPSDNADVCVVAAPVSMDHGRFQSRALNLAKCDDVDSTLRQWVIKTE